MALALIIGGGSILLALMFFSLGGLYSVLGIVFLIFGLYGAALAYYESPEAQEKEEAEKQAREIKRKQELDNFARKYGADKYIFSMRIAEDCSVDTVHALFHYEYGKYDSDKKVVVLPLSRIRKCWITEHLIYENKGFSNGMKDGAMAALTGVGTIRSARSNVKAYRTGKADVHIEFVDENNRLCGRTYLVDNYAQAEQFVKTIEGLMSLF